MTCWLFLEEDWKPGLQLHSADSVKSYKAFLPAENQTFRQICWLFLIILIYLFWLFWYDYCLAYVKFMFLLHFVFIILSLILFLIFLFFFTALCKSLVCEKHFINKPELFTIWFPPDSKNNTTAVHCSRLYVH